MTYLWCFNVAIEKNNNNTAVVAATTIWKTFCAMDFSVRINVIYRREYFKMKKNLNSKANFEVAVKKLHLNKYHLTSLQ